MDRFEAAGILTILSTIPPRHDALSNHFTIDFNSGIRVYDIRDPLRPKEIAYYNPAGTTTPSKGSNHLLANNWVAGGPDWCSAQVHLNKKDGTLWTTCQDNGLLMLKFTNGVWPLPGSNTPAGEQN